jgi:hypothetical protein
LICIRSYQCCGYLLLGKATTGAEAFPILLTGLLSLAVTGWGVSDHGSGLI